MERDQRRDTNKREFKNYETIHKIGEGSFGQVYKVRDKINGEVMVMKIIQLNNCNPNDLNEKMNEINVIKDLRH